MGVRIYVASSWRNTRQFDVVCALRYAGHEVYDFKNPRLGDRGFSWSEIDPHWRDWSPGAFRAALKHPIALRGFNSDMHALGNTEAVVLVLPCGRSAHLELGWAVAADRRTFVLMEEPSEPELMYRMVEQVCISMDELQKELAA